MTERRFESHPDWNAAGGWPEAAHTTDPNDELFGHVVENVTLESSALVDVVLVGEPFDRAVVGRKGAASGPVEIRRSLARTKTHHFDHGRLESIGDLGDAVLLLDLLEQDRDRLEREHDRLDRGSDRLTSVEAIQSQLCETTTAIHDLDALPVFLGGDNSLTYPNVAPLCREGSVGVVNLDAHLDVRAVGDDATSGTPYRQLYEDGLDAYACVGARQFETSARYHDFVRECGGEIITAEEVGDDPVSAARLALEAMGNVDSVYVSVDCDVLDASAAPGVSAPTPGGITTRELYRLLRVLASDERIAGFELVECAPPLDRDGLTVDAAARALAHFLAGYQEARR